MGCEVQNWCQVMKPCISSVSDFISNILCVSILKNGVCVCLFKHTHTQTYTYVNNFHVNNMLERFIICYAAQH